MGAEAPAAETVASVWRKEWPREMKFGAENALLDSPLESVTVTTPPSSAESPSR
jgi:hypothetical protein